MELHFLFLSFLNLIFRGQQLSQLVVVTQGEGERWRRRRREEREGTGMGVRQAEVKGSRGSYEGEVVSYERERSNSSNPKEE